MRKGAGTWRSQEQIIKKRPGGRRTCRRKHAEVGVAVIVFVTNFARTSTSVEVDPLKCGGIGVRDFVVLSSSAGTSMSAAATGATAAKGSIGVTDRRFRAGFAITPMLPGSEEVPLRGEEDADGGGDGLGGVGRGCGWGCGGPGGEGRTMREISLRAPHSNTEPASPRTPHLRHLGHWSTLRAFTRTLTLSFAHTIAACTIAPFSERSV